MKKLFTFAATALVALCANAQVNSTRVELSPLYLDAANSDKATWKFTNTDITWTNESAKSAGENHYGDINGDTCTVSFMKVSKDVEFTLNIPADRAVVRIEFWGVSNSAEVQNWAYLYSLKTSSLPDAPIYEAPKRDITNNDEIKALPYPYSPEAKKAEVAPVAVFSDNLGWFSDLKFLFDGNNQVGTTIVLYTVPEAELSKYKAETDASIRLSLDHPGAPIASKRVELSPLYLDAANSDNATWKFTNTDLTWTNESAKSAGENHYGDINGDTCTVSFMKVSKDVEFTLNIPADSAVVRIEFWGVSNSAEVQNWAYLYSLKTSSLPDAPIYEAPKRDITNNDEIKALPYPYSPEAKKAEVAPVAAFNENLGWFSDLKFLFDGNNQVGTTIVVYMVHADELEGYDWEKDPSIKNELDKPVVEEQPGDDPNGVEVITVAKKLNLDAPMYNVMGQQVNKNYKGIVFQHGNKFIIR